MVLVQIKAKPAFGDKALVSGGQLLLILVVDCAAIILVFAVFPNCMVRTSSTWISLS